MTASIRTSTDRARRAILTGEFAAFTGTSLRRVQLVVSALELICLHIYNPDWGRPQHLTFFFFQITVTKGIYLGLWRGDSVYFYFLLQRGSRDCFCCFFQPAALSYDVFVLWHFVCRERTVCKYLWEKRGFIVKQRVRPHVWFIKDV